MSKAEIYINFFTNVAVAWFSSGLIAMFFIGQSQFPQFVYFPLLGITGAYVSLQFAIYLTKQYR